MKTRFLSLVLALLLVFGMLPAEALAADTTIYINTAQELTDFAQQCHIDFYSTGKNIELMADLDMSETNFTGIPSFSGYFKGNGHVIGGIEFKDAAGVTGFIRYLEKKGVVENVHIAATITSTDSDAIIGGIAAVNEGTIKDSSFAGSISGKSITGGIAGENAPSGIVSSCRAAGRLDSTSQCGGICGINSGVIQSCTNAAKIDADDSWLEDDTDTVTSLLGSAEAIISGNDIGGICGSNDGKIMSSSNKGDVGYQNEGYNIGGIAGRNNGLIESCENSGTVRGKQDVGGIAGQFEPFLEASQEANLKGAMNSLHDTINKTIDDIDKLGNDSDAKLEELQNESDKLSDAADEMSDEGIKFINSNISSLNYLSDIVYEVINDKNMLPKVTSNGKEAIKYATAFSENLSEIGYYADIINLIRIDDAAGKGTTTKNAAGVTTKAGIDGKESTNRYDTLITDRAILITQSAILSANLASASAAANAFQNDVSSGSITMNAAMTDLSEFLVAIGNAGAAAGKMTTAANEIYVIMYPYMDKAYDEIFGSYPTAGALDDANGNLTKCLEYLGYTSDGLNNITKYLKDKDVSFTSLSNNFKNNEDQVKKSLDNISNIVREMRALVKGNSDTLEDDFKAINDQTNNIYLILSDRLDEIQGLTDGEDMIEDMSTADGRKAYIVRSCKNSGKVQGKTNIGGIAGSLDIDGGVTDAASDKELAIHYYAYALLTTCANSGLIRGTGNNIGGIVGNAAYGYISGCSADGSARSTEGNYAGGIAGMSTAQIASCCSASEVGAESYAGGIAGSATDVSGCYSMAFLYKDADRIGAILGSYGNDDDSVGESHGLLTDRIKNNYFVSDSLYGLDGVSYQGVAEPVSYEALKSKSKNSIFDKMTVLFIDEDDNLLRKTQYTYGDASADIAYPTVHSESTQYNQWDGLDGEKITHNLILRVSSEDTITVLASEVENGKSVVLIAGSFTEGAYVKAQKLSSPFVNVKDGEYYCCRKVEIIGVSAESNIVRKIRVLNETEGTNGRIYIFDDGVSEVPCTQEGQYYEFEAAGNEFSYCLVTEPNGISGMYIFIGAGAFVLAAIGGLLIVKAIKKKKKAKENTAEE